MVFQEYALFPHLSVEQNVGFGVRRGDRRERVPELLRLVGLTQYAHRFPHELSGGQQQRVALARALAPRPSVVLLDEPWSNIDPLAPRLDARTSSPTSSAGIDVTVLFVTHDREEAFSLADRIALMRDGTVVQTGSPEELYLHPADRWAAEFVGAANFVPGTIDGGLVDTLIGRFPVANLNGSTNVEALIRPEQLELSLDDAGIGEVVGREFRGHDVFYRVRLADGATRDLPAPLHRGRAARLAGRGAPARSRVAVFERVPA